MKIYNLSDIREMYDQPWRFHHNREHINKMLRMLETSRFQGDKALEYAIVFHDCVYDPLCFDNEEQSSKVWLEFAARNGIGGRLAKKVNSLILSTLHPENCKSDKELFLRSLDWNRMGETHEINDDYAEWLESYERNIFREFQVWPVEKYVEGRLAFIDGSVGNGLMTREVADYLRPLVRRKRKVGIYAGSFLPFHIGHLNVLRKAEKMFDKVIVFQGINPEKKAIIQNEFQNVSECLRHHEVDCSQSQLVDYVNSKRNDYCEPVLVRGLRNGYDLSYEINLIDFVNEQAGARGIERIPVVYVHCDREFEHISSSAIRLLEKNDAERYLPKGL